ncbi:hypothetical protein GOM49_02430 [Clostridium bovifaecis]|uniref:TATA-box binding n=1 Tax=Clostridium bovifaecis TaxID=2184719 RepID=A0A6I6EYS7_9CLOT|nr:hypothetical protein GOM49_02430 [Clostridium bovifaecis]
MEKKKKILILFLTLVAMILNYKISYAYKNVNLLQEMVKTAEGEIVESGVRTRFKSSRNGQELTEYFMDKVNYKDTKVKSYKNKENYYINFEEKGTKGFITIASSKGENIVTIDIVQKCSSNELDEIKSKIELITAPVSHKDKEYYEYLKVRLPNKDLASINQELISVLKINGAVNTSSIELNNGFSTCAYTYRYKPRNNNGKQMDLNFALSSYTSGKYLVIGTPEIVITY